MSHNICGIHRGPYFWIFQEVIVAGSNYFWPGLFFIDISLEVLYDYPSAVHNVIKEIMSCSNHPYLSTSFSSTEGEELKIKATVKAHNIYKDQAQTVIQRVTIL